MKKKCEYLEYKLVHVVSKGREKDGTEYQVFEDESGYIYKWLETEDGPHTVECSVDARNYLCDMYILILMQHSDGRAEAVAAIKCDLLESDIEKYRKFIKNKYNVGAVKWIIKTGC